jgi:uncharacterized membrane protein YhhN
MPILTLFYIFDSDNISFKIILAMFFSWCGDILLVNPRKFKLYAGVLSFFGAHILYILVFIDMVSEVNIMTFIFSSLSVLLVECFFIGKLHIPAVYKLPMIMYGIAIGFLVVFSLQVFIYYKSIVSILFVVGSILFFISDAVLAYFNTIKIMTKNPLTVVMLSYTIAQVCIVLGCINI